jgi:hypothetical protein
MDVVSFHRFSNNYTVLVDAIVYFLEVDVSKVVSARFSTYVVVHVAMLGCYFDNSGVELFFIMNSGSFLFRYTLNKFNILFLFRK